MPFGLLWCCYATVNSCGRFSPMRVTNAFRPVVVLLLNHIADTSKKVGESPMPFGLLWCCYEVETCWALYCEGLSPMPFGLLWCCYST